MMTHNFPQRITFDLPAYTIEGTATGAGRYFRQMQGRGKFGHVELEIAPYAGPHDFLLIWSVSVREGGTPPNYHSNYIPSEFREAVREGIQSVALTFQPDFGPLRGVQVTITGGMFSEVDSCDIAFRKAAALAFQDALSKVSIVRAPDRHAAEGVPYPVQGIRRGDGSVG